MVVETSSQTNFVSLPEGKNPPKTTSEHTSEIIGSTFCGWKTLENPVFYSLETTN